MRRVFFDTWGWTAIAHKDDSHHSEAFSFYKSFLLKKGVPVTTDYVLSETVTLLRSRTDAQGVSVFIDILLSAAKKERIQIERIDEKRWQRAWELSKKFGDKPSISFVDFTSFIVMKEFGIPESFTADRHFEEVGFRFKKLF